jgi:hypothetical protein
MDDAAGLQIATRLKAQTSGMAVAMRNTQNSTSMLQTAEGALDEVGNMLVRMKDLATQAADASSSTDDKTAMQSEYDSLGNELRTSCRTPSSAAVQAAEVGHHLQLDHLPDRRRLVGKDDPGPVVEWAPPAPCQRTGRSASAYAGATASTAPPAPN